MTTGSLAIITGPAAVGKSTIGRSLQSELIIQSGQLWLIIELDVFARALPREWTALGAHRGKYSELGFSFVRSEDGSMEQSLGADGRRFLAAFHQSVAAVVKSGLNVICETIVHDDEDWNDWGEALGGLPACWIGLSAPNTVLEAREKAVRATAFQGLARGMANRKPVGTYAVEADTDAETTAGIVQRIIGAIQSG